MSEIRFLQIDQSLQEFAQVCVRGFVEKKKGSNGQQSLFLFLYFIFRIFSIGEKEKPIVKQIVVYKIDTSQLPPE